MRRVRLAVLATGCALLTAACSAAGGDSPPTWRASPAGIPSEGPGVSISPIEPLPSGAPGTGSPGSSGSRSSSPSAGPSGPRTDPDVVATRLQTPVGLAMLPDGTALVGERTTGRILRVQPTAGRPVPVVRTLTGLDTAGGGGLLDLAVSPEYSQDELVYAYISTPTDNRVVEFTLTGPVTPVLTGIPRGPSGNAGRIAFDASGDLYIGTGTAGSPASAARPSSLAGKVLRVNSIGRPVTGNVSPSSPVWTTGHDGVAGLCPVPGGAGMLEVEPGRPAEVNRLVGRSSYGYPSAGAGARGPLAPLPSSTPSPGDCAVQAGRLWVTSPDGRALLSAPLAGTGPALRVGTFTAVLKGRYGRLLTVVAARDGALWLTTTNRDGRGRPVAADERVIRYMPDGAGSQSGSQV